MSSVRRNQNAARPVSTRPLSGISVGSTTSKVEMRSLAVSRRRLPSSSYSSRTLPLPTWTASGMDALLLERVEPLEDGVHVTGVGGQLEHGREIDAARELGVGGGELAQVEPFVRGAQCVLLDELVRVVASESGFDE